MLRVGFVLLVILYHGTFIGPLVYADLIPRKFVFPHQVGASLLLVLSAYFVAVTLRKGDTARWWWGKMARLLPAFFVATVVAWGFLRFLAPDGWYLPTKRDLVANLLMLWNWNGGFWRVEYVDGSYWTIPVQLLAFTLAAVVWRARLRRWIGVRTLLWIGLLLPLAQLPYHLATGGDTVYSSIVNGLGLHRWHLFVAGIAVWMVATRRLGKVHFGVLFVGAGVAHLLHTGWLTPEGGFLFDQWAALGVFLGMLALLAAAVGPDWDAWVPDAGRRAITWLAGISYGMFLVHQTTGYVVMRRLQDLGVGPSLQTVAMVGNAVLLGWLLTRFVERPAYRWLMTLWTRAGLWVGAWTRRRGAPGQRAVDGSVDGSVDDLATVPFAAGPEGSGPASRS